MLRKVMTTSERLQESDLGGLRKVSELVLVSRVGGRGLGDDCLGS